MLEKKLKGQSLSFLDEDMSIVIKKKKPLCANQPHCSQDQELTARHAGDILPHAHQHQHLQGPEYTLQLRDISRQFFNGFTAMRSSHNIRSLGKYTLTQEKKIMFN